MKETFCECQRLLGDVPALILAWRDGGSLQSPRNTTSVPIPETSQGGHLPNSFALKSYRLIPHRLNVSGHGTYLMAVKQHQASCLPRYEHVARR